MKLCTDLANDNAPRLCNLSAEQLYTATLTVGIASVSAGTLTLFMRHEKPLFLPESMD